MELTYIRLNAWTVVLQDIINRNQYVIYVIFHVKLVALLHICAPHAQLDHISLILHASPAVLSTFTQILRLTCANLAQLTAQLASTNSIAKHA